MGDMAEDFKALRKFLDEIKDKQQKERMKYAVKLFDKQNIDYRIVDETEIEINYKNSSIKFYPRTGWHTGKSIKDGRGIKKLLKQIVTKSA